MEACWQVWVGYGGWGCLRVNGSGWCSLELIGRTGEVEGGGGVVEWLGGWVHVGGGTGSMQVRAG